MRRHAQFESGKQIPLASDLMEISAGEPALLAVYRRLDLSRRRSFMQVMSDRTYAIGVRNLTVAIARRGISGYATNGTPSTIEPAEDMVTLLAHRTEFHYSANAK